MCVWICPVWGSQCLGDLPDFDICENCGWEDDPLQRDDPDYDGGANEMSLNEARKAWAEGKPIR